MPDRSHPAEQRDEARSLPTVATVLADSDCRDAFFNTTGALLYASPRDRSVPNIRRLLESQSIAYLFAADASRVRPVLCMAGKTYAGAAAIQAVVASS